MACVVIYIYNEVNFHYEIIESMIIKYREIIKSIPIDANVEIHMNKTNNALFNTYIKNKYPKIKINTPSKYDYIINCTIYDNHYDMLKHNSPNHFYISHNITPRLKALNNVYFLTPIASSNYIMADILPFSQETCINTSVPIYIVQGNLTPQRRNYNLLVNILQKRYQHDFKIKLIGRGKLPNVLVPFKNKIIVRNNLNFVDYHKEFLNGYCILPLILKKTHPAYYKDKLTSTINYARAYGLKTLIDEDLQQIYNLQNVEIFSNEDDIVNAFKKTLEDFYEKIQTIA